MEKNICWVYVVKKCPESVKSYHLPKSWYRNVFGPLSLLIEPITFQKINNLQLIHKQVYYKVNSNLLTNICSVAIFRNLKCAKFWIKHPVSRSKTIKIVDIYYKTYYQNVIYYLLESITLVTIIDTRSLNFERLLSLFGRNNQFFKAISFHGNYKSNNTDLDHHFVFQTNTNYLNVLRHLSIDSPRKWIHVESKKSGNKFEI